MSQKITIVVRIRTDAIGSQCEDEITMNRKRWESLSDSVKEAICKEAAFNMMEWDYDEIG